MRMLSSAPPLDLGSLAVIWRSPSSPDQLAVPWHHSGGRAWWHGSASSALHSLHHWIKTGIPGGAPAIWLPDYFCDASLHALREAGAALRFYPISADLSPDWAACRALAASAPPALFVLVHFFGVPVPTAPAVAFCRGFGAVLIEDAAHVLRPVTGVGEAGRFVLYSLRKHLAVPDGGLLVERAGSYAWSYDGVSPSGSPSSLPWLIKRLIQHLPGSAVLNRINPPGPPGFLDDPADRSPSAAASLSPLSHRLIAALSTTLVEIDARRRATEHALRDRLTRLPGWQPLFPADMPVTPYRLVMRCDSTRVAEQRYRQLRSRGLPVESWPDLPPEVRQDARAHQVAIALRETLLCFPLDHLAKPAAIAQVYGSCLG